MLIQGITDKPTIVKDKQGRYVIIGAIDHGMAIPQNSMLEVITSLDNVKALMMEVSEENQKYMQATSTELIVKASVGKSSINYLPGTRINEDIGKKVLKYVTKDLAQVFVPSLNARNTWQQFGKQPSLEETIMFITAYKGRFGFLDIDSTIESYIKLTEYWIKEKLDPAELDHFSYDFEKFIGDVIEFEFWQPDLKKFGADYKGKVAVCIGDYHVLFVQKVLEGEEVNAPNWETHIDTRREDKATPQAADFLKEIYRNIEEALDG